MNDIRCYEMQTQKTVTPELKSRSRRNNVGDSYQRWKITTI